MIESSLTEPRAAPTHASEHREQFRELLIQYRTSPRLVTAALHVLEPLFAAADAGRFPFMSMDAATRSREHTIQTIARALNPADVVDVFHIVATDPVAQNGTTSPLAIAQLVDTTLLAALERRNPQLTKFAEHVRTEQRGVFHAIHDVCTTPIRHALHASTHPAFADPHAPPAIEALWWGLAFAIDLFTIAIMHGMTERAKRIAPLLVRAPHALPYATALRDPHVWLVLCAAARQ